jgi:alpha-mannosidase
LGVRPRVGWQIDPFGHSALSATLLGPGVGFDTTFLGRADYADLAARTASKELHFRWRPRPDGDVATGGGGENAHDAHDDSADEPSFVGLILGSGNYGPPPGFDWDVSSAPPHRASLARDAFSRMIPPPAPSR